MIENEAHHYILCIQTNDTNTHTHIYTYENNEMCSVLNLHAFSSLIFGKENKSILFLSAFDANFVLLFK